jgi:hypothetical protein
MELDWLIHTYSIVARDPVAGEMESAQRTGDIVASSMLLVGTQ